MTFDHDTGFIDSAGVHNIQIAKEHALSGILPVLSFLDYSRHYLIRPSNHCLELSETEVILFEEEDNYSFDWYEHFYVDINCSLSQSEYLSRQRDRYYYLGITVDKEGIRRLLMYSESSGLLTLVDENYFCEMTIAYENFARRRFLIDRSSSGKRMNVWVGE